MLSKVIIGMVLEVKNRLYINYNYMMNPYVNINHLEHRMFIINTHVHYSSIHFGIIIISLDISYRYQISLAMIMTSYRI